MTSRERVLCAIRHKLPDRIPIDAIAVENKRVLSGHLRVAERDVTAALGLDGRIVNAPCVGDLQPGPNGEPLSEWRTVKVDYGTTQPHPLANAQSSRDLDAYPWPTMDLYDFAHARRLARELGRTYALRGPCFFPLFCRLCDLFGMEEAMARMLLEPALFEEALERVFDYTHEYCLRLIEACGADMPILCLGDHFATQRYMMIDPALWRKFLKPRYARLFELGKNHGKAIWFHACGNITEVLPDLIDIGVDVWETVQLHTLPLSARQLKREYGRHVTFFGGINTQQLPSATPRQVRDEVERCITDLGRGGGYICGPDHHIKPDVPAANALALFGAAVRFDRAGYVLAGRRTGR